MASYGALLLRLILGVVYVMHAYLALVVLGPSGMIGYQAKAGVPFPEIATEPKIACFLPASKRVLIGAGETPYAPQ